MRLLFSGALALAGAGTAHANDAIAAPTPISPDPRSTLKAGLHDAGVAALNLELVASRPAPEGFFDSAAPAGLPLPHDEKGNFVFKPDVPGEARGWANPGELAFGTTDLAFRGSLAIVGGYHGSIIYDISNPDDPRRLAAIACPGGQGDVGIYKNLLFVSAEQKRGRLDCGAGGVADGKMTERFRGLRIFDIGNLDEIRQVAAVETCNGSHTHTVVPDPRDSGSIYVYSSGNAAIMPTNAMPGCSGDPKDADSAAFRIDVIRVPLDNPTNASIVARPRLFANPDTGALPALTSGKAHELTPFDPATAQYCHDINVYPASGLGAAACIGNGLLIDISDPAMPRRVDVTQDPNMTIWHAGIFSASGRKIMFTDEWGSGISPRCQAKDPRTWGGNQFMELDGRKLVPVAYFKIPAAIPATSNCVAHNGGLVPVPGRDIVAQGWYGGGASVIDFTDTARPHEIAYFARGPVDAAQIKLGGYWSVYWRAGRLFATDLARGLDVLRLTPSDALSDNEIAAAALVRGDDNPQTQYRPVWPNCPVVARAYMDQLGRDRALEPGLRARIEKALARPGSRRNARTAADLGAAAKAVAGQTSVRLQGIANILEAPAAPSLCAAT